MNKRRCLFTKYEFEIGAVTLPAHIVLFAAGLIFSWHVMGQILLIVGAIGSLAAIASLWEGAKEITF